MNKLRLITGVFFAPTMDEKIRSQPNNPLHSVKLADILEHLTQKYTWQELADRIDINCFKSSPSIKSSLKFLRRTPWARVKVEQLYLKSIQK